MKKSFIKEDIAINNNASSGEVAGLDSNPPVDKTKKRKLLKTILKRNTPNAG